MLVRDLMTPNPITVRPNSDYLAAIALMRAARCRHLPVVDESGALVGMITSTDLIGSAPASTPKERAIYHDGVLTRVGDVMHTPVASVPPDYPIEEAASLMEAHRVGGLPVLEEGRLVGIITGTDIYHTLIGVLGGGSDTLRVTIEIDNLPGQFAAVTGRVAEAGGNILSIASYPAPRPDRMALTLRVEAVTLDVLLAAIEAHPGLTVRHVWEQPAGPPG